MRISTCWGQVGHPNARDQIRQPRGTAGFMTEAAISPKGTQHQQLSRKRKPTAPAQPSELKPALLFTPPKRQACLPSVNDAILARTASAVYPRYPCFSRIAHKSWTAA